MSEQHDLKLVYTGSCVDANYIKSILEEQGIGVLLRDTLKESTIAGWASGAPDDACRVFVSENNFNAAKKLIKNYLNANL